jgi:hypothetical protein
VCGWAAGGLSDVRLGGQSCGEAKASLLPERVARLVLLSPARVPQDPDTMQPSRELDNVEGSREGRWKELRRWRR